MQIKVTIDIYSGRRNPSMIMEGAEAKKLLDQIKPKTKFVANDKMPAPSSLGYRGIIIEQLDKDLVAGLPSKFTFAPDGLYSGKGFAGADDIEFEKNIFDRIKYFKGISDIKDFESVLKAEINRNRLEREPYLKALKQYPIVISNPCSCAPPHEIAWWNDNGNIQGNNNCYNYANNYRTDTYAQPGFAAGRMYTSDSGCTVAAGQLSVKDAALTDCLIDIPNANNVCPGNGHLVALVIWPNRDYHWYRKGNNGGWSHKPGETQATLFDNSGNPIADPRTANRGAYTLFCTFMQVIHGHIKINGAG